MDKESNIFYHEDFDSKAEAILAEMPGKEDFESRIDYSYGIYKFPSLSREQEFHLFRKYAYLKYKNLPTLEIRNYLVEANLRYIPFFVKKFGLQKRVDPNDVLSTGTRLLCRCIDNFDWRKNFRFGSIFKYYMLHKFKRSFREQSSSNPSELSLALLTAKDINSEASSEMNVIKPYWDLLDPKVRECLHFKFFESLSDRDAAKKANISLQKFNLLYKIGIKHLKENLKALKE